MAKFSVGGEDDSAGPSSPRPKKRRTSVISPCPHHRIDELLFEDGSYELPEWREEEESEYEEEEEEQEESEYEEEEEEEVHEGDEEREELRDDLNGPERTSAGQTSTADPCNDNRGSAELRPDGSVSVTLTDPDVLDCPICFEPLRIPVFQCENGHLACSSCCIKLGNKCPSCSWPIGYNRCRAIEKVLESVKISCRNMKYGCKESVSYSKKHDHEATCIYEPCSCPLPFCDFVGSSKQLFSHFSSKHSGSACHFLYGCLFPVNIEMEQKYLILQEQNEGVIFILSNGIELLGNAIKVSCIGPSSTKRGFSYDLIARNGASSLRLQSFTENVPGRCENSPLKGFLLVPADFVGTCGQLKLQLCIRREEEFAALI